MKYCQTLGQMTLSNKLLFKNWRYLLFQNTLFNPSTFWEFCLYIVSCRGVVQLGGPDSWYYRGGLAKVGARMSFLYKIYLLNTRTVLWSKLRA